MSPTYLQQIADRQEMAALWARNARRCREFAMKQPQGYDRHAYIQQAVYWQQRADNEAFIVRQEMGIE